MLSMQDELIIYNTDDGKADVKLYSRDGVIWMNQQQMALLFDTSKPNISMHISNILQDKELEEISVVKDYLTTAADGKNYNVTYYALQMVIAVGFRVRSIRGTQFRRWANENLSEYLTKGFVMDDERLKNPDGRPDYFDELLERIRDIRASEKRFYQKVRDLFVFQTLTCLSYVDLAAFTMDKLKEVDLAQVLAGRRGKTNVEYMVPLLPGASDILKKYGGLPAWQGGKGVLTNQKYNEYLKEVMKAADIDRPVTTHWARHTDATPLLNLKVPLQVVSKVCGHSSIKMTERIYAKLLDRTVVQEVLAVKDKL